MTSDTENYKNLKTFFNEEYNSLRAYAQSRINDTADRDAEDIVQEVALKLFSRADDVSPINNIAGFVYNAVKNKIIDLMRTNKRQVRVNQEMQNRLAIFSGLFYDSPEDLYSEAMKDELKKAIGNLKPHYREIILAIDFEGYTYNQVSLETGIPKGTLMSRRHRAISILLSMLEKKKEVIN